MRAVFRVDASKDIGTGHVMRCLTLANELGSTGWLCEFVGRRHDEGNLAESIRAHGHEAHLLPRGPIHFAADDYESWLGCEASVDASQTLGVLGHQPPDLLVVDHYAIDQAWESVVRGACRKMVVIDDLANRPHRCDVLVDGNLGRRASDYLAWVREGAILAGADYALLRPEFARHRASRSAASIAAPRRLFIALGGIDQHDFTGQILESLQDASLPPECSITVVLGGHSPWIPAVRAKASRLRWPTQVLTNVQGMADLMSRHDFAIGAAGMTAWERCCLGLPSLVVVVAENQRPGAEALCSSGAALLVEGQSGTIREPLLAGLARMMDPGTYSRLRTNGMRAVDGLGLQRVLREVDRVTH